jgi:plasmid stabilization system protein ParE
VTFKARIGAAAFDDVERLFEHLVDRARTAEDVALARRARDAILDTLQDLSGSPFVYRKSGSSPFLREVLIPFGRSGYVALFEINDAKTVSVLTVRLQIEDDYH